MKVLIYLLLGIFLISGTSAISWSGGTINIINQTINQTITGSNVTNLSELEDVNVANPPSDDEVLSWDSSSQKWINKLLNSILVLSSDWMYFTGNNSLDFNETKLNQTIGQYTSNLTGGGGGGSDGTGGWFNDSIQTNTSLNVNIQQGNLTLGDNGSIKGDAVDGSWMCQRNNSWGICFN